MNANQEKIGNRVIGNPLIENLNSFEIDLEAEVQEQAQIGFSIAGLQITRLPIFS
ncbi:MAG: hypothetical protein LAP21_00750 [Acidobacteriia bacterium]|nr:hypothetical protein [Terriglobia bacterium]